MADEITENLLQDPISSDVFPLETKLAIFII
jgi:hypothetical protein